MRLSIARMIVIIPILLGSPLAYGQPVEMFGIDILAADRIQMTQAILQHGAKKLPTNDPLTDRYDDVAPFPGARMKVGFTGDGKLERIVCQFDHSWFIDILSFDALKQSLEQTYGKPFVTAAENRNRDFEEELKWTQSGIIIQLVSYTWFAAWRIHVTHQLRYTIPTNQASQKDGSRAWNTPGNADSQ